MNIFFIIAQWFARFCFIQSTMTLISLPILIAWGLPLSLMSPLGALLFHALLPLYLALATPVFITELLHIPNAFFIYLLNKYSDGLLWVLAQSDHAPYIGFTKQNILILCSIPLITCGVIWITRQQHAYTRASILTSLLICCCFSLKLCSNSTDHTGHIKNAQGSRGLSYIYADKTLILFDSESALSSSPSTGKWLVHQVRSELVKKTGKTDIDHLIIFHPRQRAFEAITEFCNHIRIHTVYVPYWNGNLSSSTKRAYISMKKAMLERGGSVNRLTHFNSIKLSNGQSLKVDTTKKTRSYQGATYQLFQVNVS